MDAFAVGQLSIRALSDLLGTDSDRLLDELSPPRFTSEDGGPGESTYAL